MSASRSYRVQNRDVENLPIFQAGLNNTNATTAAASTEGEVRMLIHPCGSRLELTRPDTNTSTTTRKCSQAAAGTEIVCTMPRV